MIGKSFLFSCFAALICFVSHAQFQHGIKADYYNGMNFQYFVRSRVEKNIGFSRKIESPARGVDTEYFSIRYSGSITAPKSGLYNFYVLADDGVRVWVNHQLIIDAWLDQEATLYTGSIMLDKEETYDIKIDYYNSVVHSVLRVRWELPMENYQLFDLGHQAEITPIPADILTPTRSEQRQRTSLLLGKISKPVVTAPAEEKPIQTITRRPVSRPKAGTIVENEQIILKTVVFDQQSAVLKEGAAKELDHLVKYLKTFENKKIEISGYTDYLGDSVDNQILSEQRAKTIALYLTKNGIDESRVSSQGFGGRFPIVVSKHVKERNANRRVEFKIAE